MSREPVPRTLKACAPARPSAEPAADTVYVAKLVSQLAQAGSCPALRHRGETISREQLLAALFRYARALADLGIGPGHLVALLAPNHPDALAIRYAANLLGAATTYISIPREEAARAALLRQIAPDLLVVFPETAGLVPPGAQARVVAVGTGGVAAFARLDTLAAGQSNKPVACRAPPSARGVIVSSGGSTGVPKGSWRTFAAYTALVDVGSPADRRQLVNGPLAYLSQVLVDITLLGGGVVVLRDAFDAADTLVTIERERITDLFLVEPQLFELMDHPDVAARDCSSLRALTHIGASAPPTLRRRARERLGPILAHTYGSSEMSLVSILPPNENDVSDPETATSAGRVCPGVEVRFRGADGGLAEAGQGGILEVRTPTMAGGYLNRPDLELTAFHNGWYHSGDLARTDTAGRLHILGRAADIIRVEALVLTPTMIEDTLCGVSSVRYAVVVVDPVAETWIAAVEAWAGVTVDTDCCVQAVAAAYGPDIARRLTMCPVSQVPRTAQGKPDRAAILELRDEFCPES